MKKIVLILCVALCLSIGLVGYGCGTKETPPPVQPVAIEITGVKDGSVYELEKDRVAPVFNVGTATLKKDEAKPLPFTSGTAIEEVGEYVLTVTEGASEKSVAFSIVYPAPVISGITDHSTYYAGIDRVIPAFDRGEAEIVKNDTDFSPFVSGTELTEVGKYRLTVVYENRIASCLFWIKEYEWTPGEGEYLTIDDFGKDRWTHEEKGSKSIANGKMSVALSAEEDGMIKVYRDIDIRTKDYSIVQFEFAEVNAAWDNGFGISISNRNVAGWPTVGAKGAEFNRVFKDGKWYIYFDLNDAVPDASALVGLNAVTVHFEIVLEGTAKSVVLEDISFVSAIPQGAEITGIENNATYTLGIDTVVPEFTKGTATLSRNGGAEEPFESGTAISVRGSYTLKVVANGIENVISFTIVDPMAGANGVTVIDDCNADDWVLDTSSGMVGSKSLKDGEITFAISAEEDGGMKVSRDITVCTKQYSIIRFAFTEVNAAWDNGFRIGISNRNVAGWPTVSAKGTEFNRVFENGKWYIYFDLNDAVPDASALVGLDSVTLHFEIDLEGTDKSITMDEICFVDEVPQEGNVVIDSFDAHEWTVGTSSAEPDKVEITYENGEMTFKSLTDQYCEIVSQKTLNTIGQRYVRFDMTKNEFCWDANFSISIVDNIGWTGNVTANGSNFIKEDKTNGTGWYIYLELPEAFWEKEALTVTFKMTIAGYTGKYVTLNEICFVDELPA